MTLRRLLCATALMASTVLSAPAFAQSATGSYLAARHAAASDDYEAAATYFTRALARDPKNVPLMEQALLFKVAAGKVADAVPIARRLVAEDADHRIAHLVLVIDAMEDGAWDGALERLDDFGADSFNAITARLLEGWAQVGADDAEAATEAFAKLEGQRLFSVFGQYHAALAADLAGDAEAAEKAFEAAKGTNRTPTARLAEAYGRFLEGEDRADEAAEIYAEAMTGATDDPVLAAALDRATGADPSDPGPLVDSAEAGAAEALFGLASAFAREDGGMRLSLVYVRLALHLAPEMDAARVLLGNILDSRQRWADAAEAYGEIGEESPYFRIAQIGRADALGRIERVDEALETLAELEERYPDDLSLPIAQGDLMRRNERYEEAAAAYDRAIKLVASPSERHWSLFYARGVSRERIGDWDNAEKDLEQALEFRPNQAHVLNYLGYSWIEQGRNLEKAEGMIEKAVEMRPDDGFITDSLGWVQYRLGDFEKAAETMERAVELEPTDPVINDHYGDVLWKVGRKLEARFQWKRALSFAPDEGEEELKERIRAKLDDGLDAVLAAEAEATPEDAAPVAEGDATPPTPAEEGADADDG